MRINGFEQIKGFYSWVFSNQELNIKPQHISLYLFLVNQNNRNSWAEWFKVPFDLAMAGSCISSKKTYYNCLEDLAEWRLISYVKGANAYKSAVVKLEVLKDTSSVPQSEPLLEPQVTPQPEPQLEPQLEPQGTHYIKPKTINLKPKTGNEKGSPDFEKIFLEESSQWQESLMRKHKISTHDGVKEWIKEFFLTLESEGQVKTDIDDARSHCSRWIGVQLKNNKTSNLTIVKTGKAETVLNVQTQVADYLNAQV